VIWASQLSGLYGRKVTQGCPCGFLTDPQKECVCTPLQIQRYRSRVSGPLLDRIDIQVEVPAIRYQDLASRDAGEPSEIIRQRVNNARTVQLQRFPEKKHPRQRADGRQRYQALLRRERRCGEAA
jgi:magnesium chelatase family protein